MTDDTKPTVIIGLNGLPIPRPKPSRVKRIQHREQMKAASRARTDHYRNQFNNTNAASVAGEYTDDCK